MWKSRRRSWLLAVGDADMTAQRQPRGDRLTLTALGSIAVAAGVFGLKLAAYWQTGSAALYSDALESIVNLVTAAVALWTIQVASRPAGPRSFTASSRRLRMLDAVLPGKSCQITPVTPATCGVAMDVPDSSAYWPPGIVESTFTPEFRKHSSAP